MNGINGISRMMDDDHQADSEQTRTAIYRRKEERQALFYCWTRCVRHAVLCGLDRVTGNDYSHRRQWVIDREELLSRQIAILDRFHVQHDAWLATVEKFEKMFGHAVGRAETLTAVVERMELKHTKGLAACRAAFTTDSLALRFPCPPVPLPGRIQRLSSQAATVTDFAHGLESAFSGCGRTARRLRST